MILPLSVAQLQQDHVVLELECLDRLYLNAYVPKLTSEAGVAGFLRGYLGHRFASTKYAGEMADRFVVRIRDFLQREDLELVRFRKGQRKDDVMKERLRRFHADGQDEGSRPFPRHPLTKPRLIQQRTRTNQQNRQ